MNSWTTGISVIRFSALAAVLAASVVGFTRGRRSNAVATRISDLREVGPAHRFTCPMHPQVISSSAGECSLCGMALIAEGTSDGPPHRAKGQVLHLPAEIASRLRYDLTEVRVRHFVADIWAPAAVDDRQTVVAIAYNDDAAALEDGEQGSFIASAATADDPSTNVRPVKFVSRADSWDDRTRAVRFALASRAALPPGARGWVHIPPRSRATEAVPVDAVLQTAKGSFVLTVSDDLRAFTRVPVVLGKTMGEIVALASGVAPGTRILGRDVFFLDAELRLQADRVAGR